MATCKRKRECELDIIDNKRPRQTLVSTSSSDSKSKKLSSSTNSSSKIKAKSNSSTNSSSKIKFNSNSSTNSSNKTKNSRSSTNSKKSSQARKIKTSSAEIIKSKSIEIITHIEKITLDNAEAFYDKISEKLLFEENSEDENSELGKFVRKFVSNISGQKITKRDAKLPWPDPNWNNGWKDKGFSLNLFQGLLFLEIQDHLEDIKNGPCNVWFVYATINDEIYGGTFLFQNPNTPTYVILEGIAQFPVVRYALMLYPQYTHEIPKLNLLLDREITRFCKLNNIKKIYVHAVTREKNILQNFYGYRKSQKDEITSCILDMNGTSPSRLGTVVKVIK